MSGPSLWTECIWNLKREIRKSYLLSSVCCVVLWICISRCVNSSCLHVNWGCESTCFFLQSLLFSGQKHFDSCYFINKRVRQKTLLCKYTSRTSSNMAAEFFKKKSVKSDVTWHFRCTFHPILTDTFTNTFSKILDLKAVTNVFEPQNCQCNWEEHSIQLILSGHECGIIQWCWVHKICSFTHVSFKKKKKKKKKPPYKTELKKPHSSAHFYLQHSHSPKGTGCLFTVSRITGSLNVVHKCCCYDYL